MALGERLRKARVEKGLTASQVATATRMKVQVVEALEKEDFSRIPAPIYAKGFLRLYAAHLGLDPQAMIDEYLTRFAAAPAVRVERRLPPAPRKPAGVTVDRQEEAKARKHPPASSPTPAPEPPPPKRTAAKRGTESHLAKTLGRGGLRLAGRLGARLAAGGAAVARWGVGGWQFCRTWKLDLSWLRFSGSPFRVFGVAVGIVILLVFLASSVIRCVMKSASPAARISGRAGDELLLAVEPPDAYID